MMRTNKHKSCNKQVKKNPKKKVVNPIMQVGTRVAKGFGL